MKLIYSDQFSYRPIREGEIHRYIHSGSDASKITVEYVWIKGFRHRVITFTIGRFDREALFQCDEKALRSASSLFSTIVKALKFS